MLEININNSWLNYPKQYVTSLKKKKNLFDKCICEFSYNYDKKIVHAKIKVSILYLRFYAQLFEWKGKQATNEWLLFYQPIRIKFKTPLKMLFSYVDKIIST